MTDDMMNLRALVEKAPDADLLREMVDPCGRRFAAERLIELGVGSATGAAYGKKDASRLVQRNGHLCRTPRIRGRGSRWAAVRREALRLTPFCACCGRPKHLQVHHIVPFRLTRDNSQTNLIPLCRACHKRVEAVFHAVEAAGPPIPVTRLVLFCSIHATRTVALHKLKGLKSNAEQYAAA